MGCTVESSNMRIIDFSGCGHIRHCMYLGCVCIYHRIHIQRWTTANCGFINAPPTRIGNGRGLECPMQSRLMNCASGHATNQPTNQPRRPAVTPTTSAALTIWITPPPPIQHQKRSGGHPQHYHLLPPCGAATPQQYVALVQRVDRIWLIRLCFIEGMCQNAKAAICRDAAPCTKFMAQRTSSGGICRLSKLKSLRNIHNDPTDCTCELLNYNIPTGLVVVVVR